MYERYYGCRIHSATGSSGDKEAERTNSTVGDSIVGDSILCNGKNIPDYNLIDDEIACLTVKEFDSYEDRSMEMNALCVAKELVNTAPVFNEYIHALLRKKGVMHFSSTEST